MLRETQLVIDKDARGSYADEMQQYVADSFSAKSGRESRGVCNVIQMQGAKKKKKQNKNKKKTESEEKQSA